MGKTTTKTTIRGERRVGERAGRASVVLGLLTITFLDSIEPIFGVPRQTQIVFYGALVVALGLYSRVRGYSTGGFAGIVLGGVILYVTFVARHVKRLADSLRIGDYSVVHIVLAVATLAALFYIFHRPKRVISGEG